MSRRHVSKARVERVLGKQGLRMVRVTHEGERVWAIVKFLGGGTVAHHDSLWDIWRAYAKKEDLKP